MLDEMLKDIVGTIKFCIVSVVKYDTGSTKEKVHTQRSLTSNSTSIQGLIHYINYKFCTSELDYRKSHWANFSGEHKTSLSESIISIGITFFLQPLENTKTIFQPT